MFIYCIYTQYLVGAPVALITASIRRGMEVISLWHCWGGMKPRFLWQWPSAHLHFLVSCFSFSSWQYHRFSEFRSGEFAGQSSTPTHGSVDRCQILLENEISIFKKQKEAWSAPKCLGKRMQWRWFSTNTNGPTPADDIAPQIITDCENLTLDFKQLGQWASPPFLQTLGPWFPNEIQNLLSSEKRTLDHCATVQFFFSLAQVRHLWWQL